VRVTLHVAANTEMRPSPVLAAVPFIEDHRMQQPITDLGLVAHRVENLKIVVVS
jgi:hypothetical protein